MPPSPALLGGRGAGGEGLNARGEGLAEGLLLALLRSTGCSLQELVSLRLGDLDRARHAVQLNSYSEIRQARLDRQTWDALDGYVGNLGEGAWTDPLFRDADGSPLAVERAYELLLAYAAQVGMGEDELLRLL